MNTAAIDLTRDLDCKPTTRIEDWEAEQADIGYAAWEGALTFEQRCSLNQLDEALTFVSGLTGHVGGHHMYDGREFAIELAAEGMTFDDMAGRLRVAPERVARLFAQTDQGADKLLAAERLVRSPEWDGTTKQITDRTGLGDASTRYLLARLNVSTKGAAQMAQGGGTKYGPEIYEAIERLRSVEGRSFGKIAKELAMDRGTVAVICRRRGYVLRGQS